MAAPQIRNEPLSPNENIWDDECKLFTKKLRKSNPNLEFNLIAYKEFIYADFLEVPENKRNQGLGTKFFTELIALADSVNCPLALTPDTLFGSSDEARLEGFYKRFGFIRNLGKVRDFATNHTMIRPRRNP